MRVGTATGSPLRRGLRLFEFLNPHLRGEQCAGALLECRFGPREFGLAWTLAKGSKLRLSIAGADAGHFVPMPYGRPPVFTIQAGMEGSSIDIPLRIRGVSGDND